MNDCRTADCRSVILSLHNSFCGLQNVLLGWKQKALKVFLDMLCVYIVASSKESSQLASYQNDRDEYVVCHTLKIYYTARLIAQEFLCHGPFLIRCFPSAGVIYKPYKPTLSVSQSTTRIKQTLGTGSYFWVFQISEFRICCVTVTLLHLDIFICTFFCLLYLCCYCFYLTHRLLTNTRLWSRLLINNLH